MNSFAIHDRMTAAAGERTFRHLGELTRTNSETVRRYMSGQAPSAEYLASFCEALGVNADWLLTGRGPMKRAEVRAHALRQADPAELLSAMAQTLEKLIDRVERIEVFVQTLETRVRGRAIPLPSLSIPAATLLASPIPSAPPTPGPTAGVARPPAHAREPAHDPTLARGGSASAASLNTDRTQHIQLPQPKRPRPDDR